MKIFGVSNLNHTDAALFERNLVKSINELQNDGQEVEVQYNVNSFPNGQIVLSALVLGRKEETKQEDNKLLELSNWLEGRKYITVDEHSTNMSLEFEVNHTMELVSNTVINETIKKINELLGRK